MEIKLFIKEKRKEAGLTQQQLADKLGVHQVIISDYELGKLTPSLERAVDLAIALGVTLDELVQYQKAHDAYSKRLAEKFYKKDNDDSKKSDE